MNSVDKMLNCILPSGTLTFQYFEYVNTLFRSGMSQGSENQPIMSLKYTVMMPH